MAELESAVHGWKQAVGIMRKLRDGLRFTVLEMDDHKDAFKPDPAKAARYEDARIAMRLADDYLSAMDKI
jgi:hypothetical protein